MLRKKSERKVHHGATLCSLLLLLSLYGCGTKIETPVIQEQKIPVFLVEETPVPQFNGKSNEDLLDYVFDLRYALELCNADKNTVLHIVKK